MAPPPPWPPPPAPLLPRVVAVAVLYFGSVIESCPDVCFVDPVVVFAKHQPFSLVSVKFFLSALIELLGEDYGVGMKEYV